VLKRWCKAPKILEIACLHGVTAYDACYIALAERNGVPLLTADTRLAESLSGGSFEIMTLGLFQNRPLAINGEATWPQSKLKHAGRAVFRGFRLRSNPEISDRIPGNAKLSVRFPIAHAPVN